MVSPKFRDKPLQASAHHESEHLEEADNIAFARAVGAEQDVYVSKHQL